MTKRGYYSQQQREVIARNRTYEDGGSVTNWWRTKDGRAVEVTSVATSPPNFPDVLDLGEVVEWIKFGAKW